MKAAATARPLEQLPTWAKTVLVVAVIVAFLLVMAIVPFAPVQPYLDFQVLYQADMGLLRGIPVYDYAGQVQMIARLAGVTPQQVNLLPFPYPPWYALTTTWLVWLPITAAARVWFGINLLLLFGTIILLTESWPLLKRVAAFGLGFFFLPVLGGLLVGQYGFPLLLGAALMIHALQHQKAAMTALAAVLLTFKPHLGALILLAVLIHLWQRKDAFGRRALLHVVIAGIVLFLAGFLADPAWPVSYGRSLLGFQSAGDVPSCVLCAGLPAIIANSIGSHQGLHLGYWIGGFIFMVLAAPWAWKRRDVVNKPFALVALAGLIVLLVSPYLLNYDFLLLLVPMALLASGRPKVGTWVLLGLVYVMPFAAVSLFGRQGNIVFSLCAAVLMAMLYWKTQALDVSPSEA